MHNTFLLLLSVFALVNAAYADEDPYHHKFSGWMNKHKKYYTSADYHTKFSKFKRNHDFVEQHNAQKRSYEVELNELADMSNEEYREVYLGLKGEFAAKKTASGTLMIGDPVEPAHAKRGQQAKATATTKTRYVGSPPGTVDWQAAGAVTPVVNQGQCGCCWAFAATAAIEGMTEIFTGTLVNLSEQNLLDCTAGSSCNGGYVYDAVNYTIANMGMAKTALYPSYSASKKACRYTSTMKGTTVNSVVSMLPGSEDGLLQQIAVQPVAIVIDASLPSFQFYKSGIYADSQCSTTSFNHAVLVTGYGTNGTGTPYWRLKNQWGTNWGQSGYMQILRGSNMCNLAAQSTYPTMAVPQPTFYVYGDAFMNSWVASISPLANGFTSTSTLSYKNAYAISATLAPGGSITMSLPIGSLGYKTLHYTIQSSISGQFKITLVAGKGITWTMTQSTWANTWVPSAMTTRPNTSFSQITFANIASSAVTVYIDEIYFTTS